MSDIRLALVGTEKKKASTILYQLTQATWQLMDEGGAGRCHAEPCVLIAQEWPAEFFEAVVHSLRFAICSLWEHLPRNNFICVKNHCELATATGNSLPKL
eukprot:3597451-Pyramimonas_sp.AAC.1